MTEKADGKATHVDQIRRSTPRPEVTEGTIEGRRYRKPSTGPYASYPPSPDQLVD